MILRSFIIFLLLFSVQLSSQVDTIQIDGYSLFINESNIYVTDINGDTVHSERLNKTDHFITDFDNSGTEELILIDSLFRPEYPIFIIYLYITDKFRLLDSLISPVIKPYPAYTEDIGKMIIVTGDNRFTDFLTGDADYLPVVCWAFDGNYLVNVNNLVYDVFISENDYLTDFISDKIRLNGKSCWTSKSILPVLVSVYINYLNAGENSLAEHFLDMFYLCEDKELLKAKLNKIYNNR